jgi:hypothetical protein
MDAAIRYIHNMEALMGNFKLAGLFEAMVAALIREAAAISSIMAS